MAWEAVKDESSGRTYYFNSATNETSWEVPPGFFSPGEGPLPANWSGVVDEATGSLYYFNSASNETSWTRPEPDEDARPALSGALARTTSFAIGARDASPGSAGGAGGGGLRGPSTRRVRPAARPAARPGSKARGTSPGRTLVPFLAGATKSMKLDKKGLSVALDEIDEEPSGPSEDDPSFDAKVERFKMFEAKVTELAAQVRFSHPSLRILRTP
jgi:hypothetical protein